MKKTLLTAAVLMAFTNLAGATLQQGCGYRNQRDR